MAEYMGGDSLPPEGATVVLRGLAVTGHQPLNSVPTHGTSSAAGKYWSLWVTRKLAEPGFQECDDFGTERSSALLPAFPVAAHMGSGAQNDVVSLEPDQLRDAQSGLYRDQEKDLVSTTNPGACVGSANQRIDLVTRQVLDWLAIIPLAWDGQYLLAEEGVLGLRERDIAEE
jgi:hypothetical protein